MGFGDILDVVEKREILVCRKRNPDCLLVLPSLVASHCSLQTELSRLQLYLFIFSFAVYFTMLSITRDIEVHIFK
jgi:hypothetical protein